MTAVRGKLLDHPDPQSVKVTATLVDLNGDRRSGYVATVEGELHYPIPVTPAADGSWELDLTPNADIETGWGESLWLVTEGRVPQYGRPAETHVSVPAAGGPYWLGYLRVDPPGGAAEVLESSATAAVTAHVAEADPHGDRVYADTAITTAVTAEQQRADAAYEPAGAAAAAEAAAVTTAAADAEATYMTLTAGDTLTGRADALEDRATVLERDVAPVRPRVTVAEWMAVKPFRAAHRGGGHEGPEHTLLAYTTAVAQGAQAIEVSVQLSADGVLVCWHDTSLERMTDGEWAGAVSDYTWYQLKERVKVKAWPMLGAGFGDVEITRLEDVLDRFLGKVVILLEPKTNDAVVPVQDLLASYPIDLIRDTVIWKGYYQTTPTWAVNNGLTRWGYVDAGTTDAQMDTHASKWSFWGVPHTMTDQRILDVLNRPDGKEVMCWEVHRHSEVQRLANLTGTGTKRAVDGYMVSDWAYLAAPPPHVTSTTNTWATQIKQPGDLGHANYDPVYALKSDAQGGVFGNVVPNLGWLLGSRSYLSPLASYRIAFELMLESIGPAGQHCGIAFGRQWDDKYAFNNANQTSYQATSPGGYHLVLRVSTGNMRLYKHVAGQTSGIPLNDATLGNAETPTEVPVAGAWMGFEIDVTPTTLTLRRTDTGTTYTATYTDSDFRGGFLHLSNGSINSLANVPHLRGLTVAAL